MNLPVIAQQHQDVRQRFRLPNTTPTTISSPQTKITSTSNTTDVLLELYISPALMQHLLQFDPIQLI